MNPAALQRQAALAGAALLALLLVIALDRSGGEPLPAVPPPVPQAQWETATVGIFGQSRLGETTACGVTLTQETRGIAHPVLPCGVDLVVSYHGHEVPTEVIERGGVDPESQFDLSPALADDLGIANPTEIRWRFAG